ncbi:MAG: methyl acetate hydrolase [Chloroflexi bacterium]|nr:MAG: methyl acetate hydrolase [Chloroflexota bacterium]
MSLQSELDQLLSAGVAEGAVPGIVAIVTNADGAVYAGAFGPRSLGEPAPMTMDTVGAIASMSKPITAAAVMQLVEQGRLDLDAPAAAHLPYLGEVQVLTGFDADGQPLTRPPSRAITMRHLLSHTSGFAYDTWDADLARYRDATGANVVPTTRAGLRTPLMFDPGERCEYGIGIDWAGLVVEAITGVTLGDYLRAHVFEPLGMHHTAFRWTTAMASRAIGLHARAADGSLKLLAPREKTSDFDEGGSGLLGTVPDYARFAGAFLNAGAHPGGRLLAAESVHEMARNQIGDLRVTRMRSTNARMSSDAEFMPGIPKTWGLGFQINEAPVPGGRSAGSLSWAGMRNSYFWIDRQRGVSGIVLSQLYPFADARAVALFERFERATYANLPL